VTLTLNLTPEAEAGLLAEAQSAGLPLEQFLSRQLEAMAKIIVPAAAGAGSNQWEKEFDDWLDSFPQSPVLSEEALRRETWYPDRW
jgi:hypothetical protein